MKIKFFGESHYDTLDSLNEMGRISLATKKSEVFSNLLLKESIKYFKKLELLSYPMFGEVNQYSALCNNNIGCAYFNLGDFETSIEY